MKLLIDLMDTCLASKGAFAHNNTSLYALPPETNYDTYEEVYREYKVMNKIFTILVRKTGDEYWARCGYKDSAQSKIVEGFPDRDITSRRICVVVDHCYNHIDKMYDIVDQ